MESQTTLVSKNIRLQEWANMVRECQARPQGVTIPQWCEQHSITTCNYYYRKRAVQKACLDALPSETMERLVVPVPAHIMESSSILPPDRTEDSHEQKNPESETDSSLELVCGKVSIHVREQTSMELLSKVLEVVSHVE